MKTFLRICVIAIVASVFGGYFIADAAQQRARLSFAATQGEVPESGSSPELVEFQRLGPFSHNTREHKTGRFASCAACHDMPEKNWTSPRRDKLAPFPDVTQYPYHDSCRGCHVNDGFRNVGFCSSCHTADGFRARGGRGVRPFPNRQNPMQFKTLFPHDVHQDLLAVKERNTDHAPAHFVNAAFSMQDPPKKTPDFYNCSICHKSYDEKASIPKNLTRSPFGLKELSPLESDSFARPLTAAFFKDSPDGHESCFSCHYRYENLPKGKQSCAGCHELTRPFKPYFDRNLINRYSLKFDHTRTGHVEKDCMACHLRITQNTDVRVRDAAGVPIVADVPIVACRDCHEKAGQRQDISMETDARAKNPTFQCTYCHTSAVGRFEIPVSHRKPGSP